MKKKIGLFALVGVLLTAVVVFAQNSDNSTYGPAVIKKDGGNTMVVKSGGELELLSGATLDVQSGVTSDFGGDLNIDGCLKMDDESELCSVDVTVATADVLTLNATAVQLVAGVSGKVIVPLGVMAYVDYNSAAYAAIAAGDDFALKYTDSAGAQIMVMEATGFVDQTSDQVRYAFPSSSGDVALVASADVVLHMLNSEITTGDSDIKYRVFYKLIPATL